MPKIIPFKIEHLEVMDIRPREEELLKDESIKAKVLSSYAVTGFEDGRVVACGGIVPQTGNIWLIPSIYVKDYTVEFCRELRNWLFQAREDLGLKTLHTICLNDELHNNWMKFLGFTSLETNEGLTLWSRTWG